jgi:hypothetical protein
LPREVLAVIAGHVADRDIPPLLRVNSEWYAAAIPHLFRKVRLDENLRIVGPGYALDADIDTSADAITKAEAANPRAQGGPCNADAANEMPAHAHHRPLFRTSWLRQTHTLIVAAHDPALCAGLDAFFPCINKLRCPLATHADKSLCAFYAVKPRILIHWGSQYDTPSHVPATPASDTHVYEFDIRGQSYTHHPSELYMWLSTKPPAAARVVVVYSPLHRPPLPLSGLVAANNLAMIMLWSRVGNVPVMAVGSGIHLRPSDALVAHLVGWGSDELHGVLPAALDRVTRTQATRSVINSGLDPQTIEAAFTALRGHAKFCSLDEVLANGELDDIYSHDELKRFVLGEVDDSRGGRGDES